MVVVWILVVLEFADLQYNRLLRGNIILHPATFVMRHAMMEIGGFDSKLKYAMDYDLWLRLGSNNHPLCLDKLLSCFRIHNGSLSSSKVAEAFAEEKRIRYEMLAKGHYCVSCMAVMMLSKLLWLYGP
jgi:hypothetical protein